MTMITILPVTTEQGAVSYRAVSGEKQSSGATVGAALDALTAQFSDEETSTLVIVQKLRPDYFFSASQQQRLEHLMERWRVARDQGKALSTEEQAELEALVDAELDASSRRAATLADDAGE